MSPFIVIAALKVISTAGVQDFWSQVNLLLHLSLLFLLLLLPVLSFCVKARKIKQYEAWAIRKNKQGVTGVEREWKGLSEFNKSKNREELWVFL